MKAKKIAVLLSTCALLVPATAQAHISLHPNTVPAGAFATLDVRVPGEQEGAYATKVAMHFPSGFTGVDTADVPGWNVKVTETKLATPIKEGAETIDAEVSQVTWTWTGPLGKVNDGQFVDFPLSIAMSEHLAGRSLLFPAVESYSNGQIVHWIEAGLTSEHPAPRINMTAPGGVIQDVAGHEAGPAPGQTGASHTTTTTNVVAAAKPGSGASKGLGIAALILGALGLIAGLGAFASSRRGKAAA